MIGADRRNGYDRSALEAEFDDQVEALLLRIEAQERQALAAMPDVERLPSWPSWSLDTGLTDAQEQFVEAWSPQHVLENSRSVRNLILVLRHWVSSHRDDIDFAEALMIFGTLADAAVEREPLQRLDLDRTQSG